MILVCVRSFGNFEPGDEVEVEDGAKFDTYHFEAKPVEEVARPKASKGTE